MNKKWYVIHTLTGQEEKVKAAIEARAKEIDMADVISQIMIPTERVSEVKAGKRKISERKFFPGYVLVEMELTDDSWYLIKSIPGVSKFISSGSRPVALSEEEIKTIVKQTEERMEKPMPRVIFEKGESIRITEGPFTNFNGVVEEIHPEKGKLKVTVTIFGRATPVELEYWQVERV